MTESPYRFRQVSYRFSVFDIDLGHFARFAQLPYDVVIFGHTHHAGSMPLNRNRARYFNTGSWKQDPHYITIDKGEISLKRWQG